ncbi:N-acetyltransferase [Providencia vermicola]|uniref:N-acetyltransferase n=1 Tax=Providencia stuartii TaxID=588 RepID=A0ABD5L8W3_PROST|nr:MULTISPECIES: N-acetyltransferase [Providencia]ELR5046019.1 N-acetyltransferase [Providencia rettgeri]ELR5290800.1 N-acetyltransferase [Providencia stuartii]MCR4179314.1 N-acetyltransferase [Providencia vermicola]URE80475.1 N-acetyltransferase [Providencia stuartii]
MPIQYRLMQITDCENVAQLLQANSESQGGGLLGDYPLSKVKMMFTHSTHTIVAYDKNFIVGVVFSFSPYADTLPPLAKYITQQFSEFMENNWFYGPVCIDKTYRGKGILQALFDALRAKHAGNPIAFINASNQRSLIAHQKIGMQEVAQFTFNNVDYYLVTH